MEAMKQWFLETFFTVDMKPILADMANIEVTLGCPNVHEFNDVVARYLEYQTLPRIHHVKRTLDSWLVDENGFIRLTCNTKKDYRWKDASVDVDIHEAIYSTLPHAKYISYTMPPYTTAYSLEHSLVIPQDYYGFTMIKEIPVYDPQNFNDWGKRAAHEISNYFKNDNAHLLLIKGFGLISYDRDLTEMVKKVAILENSCRLLTINSVN